MKRSEQHGLGSFFVAPDVGANHEPGDGLHLLAAQVEEHDARSTFTRLQVQVGRKGRRLSESLEGPAIEDVTCAHNAVARVGRVENTGRLFEADVEELASSEVQLEAVHADGPAGTVRDGHQCEQRLTVISDENLFDREGELEFFSAQFDELSHAVLHEFAEHGRSEHVDHGPSDVSPMRKLATGAGDGKPGDAPPELAPAAEATPASRRLRAIVYMPGGRREGLLLRGDDLEAAALALARRYAPEAPLLIRYEPDGYVRAWAFPVKILIWR